jgi:hypothetical protein
MPKLISQKNFSNLIIVEKTTSSTNQAVLHEFSKNSFRSAKYQIQITRGNSYQTTEFLVVHDGTTSYNTEYGTIKSLENLCLFDSDVSGNLVRILITPTSSDFTEFKVTGNATQI